MAVEYRIICDDCGEPICSSLVSVKYARADAQTKHQAAVGKDHDWCRPCTNVRMKALSKKAKLMTTLPHSISAGTAWPEPARKFGPTSERPLKR